MLCREVVLVFSRSLLKAPYLRSIIRLEIICIHSSILFKMQHWKTLDICTHVIETMKRSEFSSALPFPGMESFTNWVVSDCSLDPAISQSCSRLQADSDLRQWQTRYPFEELRTQWICHCHTRSCGLAIDIPDHAFGKNALPPIWIMPNIEGT